MKKITLIILVIIITAIKAFAEDNIYIEDVYIEIESPEPTVEKTIVEKPIVEKPVVEKPAIEEPIVKKSVVEEPAVDIVSKINLIQDDKQKVKEWAKFNKSEYYVIINKKNCSATVHDKNGNEIENFEIGIGRDIGDDFNDTSGLLGKPKNTTPAGEYALITNVFNKSAYGDLTLSLGAKANKTQSTKKVVALHKIPKFRMQDRYKKFYDGDLANNRMSHGCINFTEKDFKEFIKYIHGGLKVYILPEEADNQLILTKNDTGDLELTQTKY